MQRGGAGGAATGNGRASLDRDGTEQRRFKAAFEQEDSL